MKQSQAQINYNLHIRVVFLAQNVFGNFEKQALGISDKCDLQSLAHIHCTRGTWVPFSEMLIPRMVDTDTDHGFYGVDGIQSIPFTSFASGYNFLY